MSDTERIWVIGWDYGSEGKTGPKMAFDNAEEAQAVKAMIEKNPSATRVYLAEVPIWKP